MNLRVTKRTHDLLVIAKAELQKRHSHIVYFDEVVSKGCQLLIRSSEL